MRVLLWSVTSAGDGGGDGKESIGDDVGRPEVVTPNVSTGVIVGHDAVLEARRAVVVRLFDS